MKSTALKLFFQAERESCNQMVTSIQHQSQQLDIDDISWFISNCLDPLMVNLDGQSNQITFPVAHAGFKHGLELASLNWLKNDSKKEITIKTWNELHLEIINIIQQEPYKVFSQTSNVLSLLLSFDNNQPIKWLTLMSTIAGKIDSDKSLIDAGIVCAWMAGLAHFRESALKQLPALSAGIVRVLFGLSDSHDLTFHLDELRKNRWPKANPLPMQDSLPIYTIELRIGSCDLLGGEFPLPPMAFVSGEQFFIKSNKLAWRLYVDAFGSTLIPFDFNELKDMPKTSNLTVSFPRLNNVQGLNDINETSSIAILSDTILLTSNETFSVIILSTSNTSNSKAGL